MAVAGDPTGLPRVDVVSCLWQCDKDNHGWREGRRRPSLPSCDLRTGLHPASKVRLERKKNILFLILSEGMSVQNEPDRHADYVATRAVQAFLVTGSVVALVNALNGGASFGGCWRYWHAVFALLA